ncbi:hypothetical protein BDV95DRAFT_458129, partial [Massariosphaeria phaeospora]
QREKRDRQLIEETESREAERCIQQQKRDHQLIKETEAREAEERVQREKQRRQRIEETEAREAEERIQREKQDRQLIEETETREAEERIQREKRDHQQSDALFLKLYKLERTIDPLLAPQIYNNRFCPLISRLPEELLLCILDFLRDDVVALHILRVVSRTFFRLLNYQSVFWRGTDCSIPTISTSLPIVLRRQFRQLLQRDGRCDYCRRWNDANAHRLFDDCKFQQNDRLNSDGSKVSLKSLYCTLYCYACRSRHDVCQFSSTYQQALGDQPERRCLGQQGSVQLCGHVQITWARIKAHIDNWRQQQCGGDWQACLDSFNIECHNKSHDTRCTASEAPTWPRARLRTSRWRSDLVLLNLEWTPHSRIDVLGLTSDGRIPASKLRAMFQKLRSLGPADILYPRCRPGALPEMSCFSPSSRLGQLIYYKSGKANETRTPPASFRSPPYDQWLLLYDGHDTGRNGKRLDIRPHYLRDGGKRTQLPECIVVNYEKDIMICKTTDIANPAVNIIPTDHWLHAMDTDTYPHPQASQIRPQCSNSSCTNFYRRRKEYYYC